MTFLFRSRVPVQERSSATDFAGTSPVVVPAVAVADGVAVPEADADADALGFFGLKPPFA
ncbi:hypothetical protein GCM10025867_29310 [Frondihabitans sucicola]|uniref:Uncharacterized protein n=1 Tax=Frondihabitans sucicola TaxID=1268041 RepID=A0ABN6Y3Y1_9MICO|nr:hypothetical protein [Frondihabitans sucicola]BDZ50690.1 hypothetical protein GCM10025867_29310 [Frondihabitans sucicola]